MKNPDKTRTKPGQSPPGGYGLSSSSSGRGCDAFVHGRRSFVKKIAPVLLSVVVPFIAMGQAVPKITSMSPEWVQRGTTVDLVLSGTNLGAVNGFVFSGEAGLSATNLPAPVASKPSITIESTLGGISRMEPAPVRDDKRVVARVTAVADAALTPREVRVLSPGGISN